MDIWTILSFASIDWLFWSWVVVTILMFIDLFIPDPIPFIDEIILIVLFFVGLGALALRGSLQFMSTIYTGITHPGLIAFIVTLIIILSYGKIKNKYKTKNKS
jgi:hypothetical protein